MTVNSKELVNAPVRTQAGQAIGRVASVDFEADTGRLAALHVRIRGMVPHLLDNELLVSWSQIVSITKDEVVVKDTSVPADATAIASSFGSPSAQFSQHGNA
ncbi:MAG: PRC-barrel domain-containing protein [Patescibacteria group bacterium]